jgi:hypothetical protein
MATNEPKEEEERGVERRRKEEENESSGIIPLTSSHGRPIERPLDRDEEDEDEAERRAAEEHWERTLDRLKSELVPVTHVVAIDGSPNSDRAFSWAVRSLPRHDRLLLVYGTRKVPMPGLEVTLLERRSADEQRRKQRRKARTLAQHYAHRCEDAGVTLSSFLSSSFFFAFILFRHASAKRERVSHNGRREGRIEEVVGRVGEILNHRRISSPVHSLHHLKWWPARPSIPRG